MKRILNILLVVLLVLLPQIARAEPNAYFNFKAGTPLLLSITGKALAIGSQSTDGLKFRINGVDVATMTAAGMVYTPGTASAWVPYVPTLVATPVISTNSFLPGLNVIPTNAASNAAFLGADATVVPGKYFVISNASGASQRIKAAGGATMNGATAGGYIVLASLATVECFNQSATNQVCLQPVIPTPAGP